MHERINKLLTQLFIILTDFLVQPYYILSSLKYWNNVNFNYSISHFIPFFTFLEERSANLQFKKKIKIQLKFSIDFNCPAIVARQDNQSFNFANLK